MAKVLMERDPVAFMRRLDNHERDFRRLLALDLATSTGVAIADVVPGRREDISMLLSQWDLRIGDYDASVLRFLRLKAFLTVVKPDFIILEDCRFTGTNETKGRNISAIVARAVTGAEFLGGLKVTVVTWAEERKIPVQAVGSGQLKKAATGKGNASKEEMIRACNAQFGTDFDPKDYEKTGVDNIADAAHLLKIGLDYYAEALA